VHTLAECLLELIGMRLAGPLHLGSTDSADRASLARGAAALLGFSDARIADSPGAAPAAGRAVRHKNGILRVDKARALLGVPLLSAEGSMRKAFQERPR